MLGINLHLLIKHHNVQKIMKNSHHKDGNTRLSIIKIPSRHQYDYNRINLDIIKRGSYMVMSQYSNENVNVLKFDTNTRNENHNSEMSIE